LPAWQTLFYRQASEVFFNQVLQNGVFQRRVLQGERRGTENADGL